MLLRFPAWRSIVALSCFVAACGRDATSPPSAPPAAVAALTELTQSGEAGAQLPGVLSVEVTDAAGKPVPNATVTFAVTAGNGAAKPHVLTTNADGQATASWTLGTIAGTNEVTVSVAGLTDQLHYDATSTPGAVNGIVVSPARTRLLVGDSTAAITAHAVDVYGNVTTSAPSFTVRDPTLLSVDPSGNVQALRRGASTYVVASANGKSDSTLVTVLDVGQSICTGVASPVDLAVGQVVTDASGDGFCVHASADAEYALIPYFNSSTPGERIQLAVTGQGLSALAASSASSFDLRPIAPVSPRLVPDQKFENHLRARERVQMPPRLAGARAWFRAQGNASGPSRTATLASTPTVGSLLHLNANGTDFCDNPDIRTGRVVAITDGAIVVADTANPPGGFTDAEYQSIGVTFDTLVNPVDTSAFGTPSDIDHNGHVVLFFTRAVNELTSAGASSVVLGFFYQRDLLPKTSASGNCAGSNVGEIFYLLVPDTGGVVNSNKRSKGQVVSFTNGTVAHEYEHLINASRRMYVNDAPGFEEKWLDEGLAHTAEELNFFRASGTAPRANFDASAFADPRFADAFATFELNNFKRYISYLQSPESQGPIGVDPSDDDLPTRGAVWSFLRYVADHQPPGTEQQLWHALVNSTTSGLANLTQVLGQAPTALLRDWVISVYADDNAAGIDERFQQPSWNMRSAIPAGGAAPVFGLASRPMTNNVTSSVLLSGGSGSFMPFAVAGGQDALLTVTAANQALPAAVQLAVVRVR
jgi:hypothetical protein